MFIFQRAECRLKLKQMKYHLFKREVAHLGHVVSPAGISTDPAKIEVIQNWPTPKNVTTGSSSELTTRRLGH